MKKMTKCIETQNLQSGGNVQKMLLSRKLVVYRSVLQPENRDINSAVSLVIMSEIAFLDVISS